MKKVTHLIMVHELASLDLYSAKDSSSKYVITLAKSLKDKIDRITIVSSVCDTDYQDNNIFLRKCGQFKLWNFKNVYRFIIENLSSDDKIVFLIWGYNPNLLYYALKLKKHGKVFSIIYDAHEGALNRKKFIKSCVVDAYYSIGRKMVNGLDGVISFNPDAKEKLKLKIPFLYSLPAVEINSRISQKSKASNTGLKFLYAGTLCDYNLTFEMVRAFSSSLLNDEILFICGDGPSVTFVKEVCEINEHIKYLGRIDKKMMEKLIEEIDVFVCLRDTRSVVCKYSFPSKIPDYIQYRKPILCSKVSNEPLFQKSVFLVNGNTEKDIVTCINTIRKERQRFQEITDSAYQYLKLFHDSDLISADIINFFNNNIKEN